MDLLLRTFFGSFFLTPQVFGLVQGPAHLANSLCEIVNKITRLLHTQFCLFVF
jgi:hypothetical protein